MGTKYQIFLAMFNRSKMLHLPADPIRGNVVENSTENILSAGKIINFTAM